MVNASRCSNIGRQVFVRRPISVLFSRVINSFQLVFVVLCRKGPRKANFSYCRGIKEWLVCFRGVKFKFSNANYNRCACIPTSNSFSCAFYYEPSSARCSTNDICCQGVSLLSNTWNFYQYYITYRCRREASRFGRFTCNLRNGFMGGFGETQSMQATYTISRVSVVVLERRSTCFIRGNRATMTKIRCASKAN